MSYPILKRLFDVVLAGIGLLLLIPAAGLIALFVKLSDGGPVFYTQIRIGQFGRPFRIRKFRSMVLDAERLGLPVTKEEDPRITRVGRFLRRSKLDELPQLWNVLVGTMSFVGPRPEVACYVERYTPQQREILNYKPGITDMATLQFRNEEALLRGAPDVEAFYVQYCLPKKITLNRQYAQRASLTQDGWIILQTLVPYWMGVVALYSVILCASLWFAFELRFDFQGHTKFMADFRACWPWLILPQLFLLLWRKQCHGLVSYFSFLELMQTGLALGAALLIHIGIRVLSHGELAPAIGIIGTHFVLSLWGITWARLFLKFLREDRSAKASGPSLNRQRIAIVGAGDLGTRLALDLISREVPTNVVAFFDDDPRAWNQRPYDIPVAGMPECILNREWLDQLDEVIVALPEAAAARSREIGALLQASRLKVSSISTWPAVHPLVS